MAKRKSRFPSYGLVRGASHAQGGVAGMVAGEQPVELEGGEWIIPKEAVPDYLPVLKQITNEGRAMQQMQNGNSAMDALIASASMENGITQPKSPMYQDGGKVFANKEVIPYKVSRDAVSFDHTLSREESRDAAAQRTTYPPNRFFRPSAGPAMGVGSLKGVGLNLLLNSLTGGATSGYNAIAALAGAALEAKKWGSDKTQVERMMEGKQPFDPVYFSHIDDSNDLYSATKKGWRKLSEEAVTQMREKSPEYFKDRGPEEVRFEFSGETEKEQGGPINQYGHGGQMQPRKQQEIRNPEVYGPPTSMMTQMETDTTGNALQDILNQLQMREVNQSINPFTGDSLNFEEDSLRLLGKMKKSHMPTYGRKKMQQGGPVMYQQGGLVGEGQPLERRYGEAAGGESPGGYFPLASQAEPGALMGSIRSDRRIKPLQPDTYLQKIPLAKPFDKSNLTHPLHQEEVEEVPKLSTAYLASFGMETPLSRRQGALLYRKGIAPQTLNPQVKGLINRALVQRLTNEDD